MNKDFQQYEEVGELVSIFQRGRHWYVHYRVDGKPVRHSLKTVSKKEARRKALAVERDLVNGEYCHSAPAPLICHVVDEYISHLRAQNRSQKTITKYQFCFKLMLALAAERGITRIDQVDLKFVDAFKLARDKHRAQPKKGPIHAEGQS